MHVEKNLKQFMCLAAEDLAVAEQQRLCDMLSLEDPLWQQGFSAVAGVDEAGRGPLAGPVVAAAVVLGEPLAHVNDSKRLQEAQRRHLFEKLMGGPHLIGVAALSSVQVDALGIQQANYQAMRDAIQALPEAPDFVLVDGYALSGISQPTMRVIKGDSRSLSIAAASIIAKVTRDTILVEMDKRYPEYGFARNKGYGTREHLQAIDRYGPCPEHRRSFAPFCQTRETAELL